MVRELAGQHTLERSRLELCGSGADAFWVRDLAVELELE